MNLQFSKYHGTGNDFIMIDVRKNVMPVLTKEMISTLCDRHFGIGADGLILLEESENYDFRMTYYNADGLPGTMCGNGGRCTVAFALHNGWIENECMFEASDGRHTAAVQENGHIRLQLSDVQEIKKVGQGYFLNTGSPHLVIFEKDIDQLDIVTPGKMHRYDKSYKGGTNVNFVEKTASGIKVRTYERGVEAETLSCGTGVTAAAIASTFDSPGNIKHVAVITAGGALRVDFKQDTLQNRFSDIYLTGPAVKVFEGTAVVQ